MCHFTIHLFTDDGIVQPTEQDHSDKEDDCGNVGLFKLNWISKIRYKIKSKNTSLVLLTQLNEPNSDNNDECNVM